MWQDTMLAQFHDCIPGTTIRPVVDDNLEIYSKRSTQAKRLVQAALDILATDSKPCVIDPLRLQRSQVFEQNGQLAWLETDSHGLGSLIERNDLSAPRAYQEGNRYVLRNTRFELVISEGRITSLVDLAANRELITVGPGAVDGGLVLYEDYPLTYDAWDAEIYHLKSYTTLKFTEVSIEESPLRASLIGKVSFGRSSAIVKVPSFG